MTLHHEDLHVDHKLEQVRMELERVRKVHSHKSAEHEILIEERTQKLNHLNYQVDQILNEIVNPRTRCRQLYNAVVRESCPQTSSYIWTLQARVLQMEHCCQIYQNQLEKSYGILEMAHEFCDRVHHEASFVNSEEAKESMHKVADLTEEIKELREGREKVLEMQREVLRDLAAKYLQTSEKFMASDVSLTDTEVSSSELESSSPLSTRPTKGVGAFTRASILLGWFGKRGAVAQPPVVNFV